MSRELFVLLLAVGAGVVVGAVCYALGALWDHLHPEPRLQHRNAAQDYAGAIHRHREWPQA